ncbi:MAG: thymidine phosphorylase [Candidatus Gastranaerophilales bacterium]|nr:thymidine phosphorylase [Candidatus Gastranaerophilales bacterium]
MRAVDLIQKKKEGKEHTKEEIYFLIENYMQGKIEDYQMSAWLMAVCFRGLSDLETAYLTKSFIDSGDILDFSSISDCIADKHSTGGVGDKVTLVLIPILASLGVYSAKLSGRGLGFTGGTIDKLESIPNFKVELTNEEFYSQIRDVKAAISSQSPNLTPADGKIYALRDVTATVDNKSLIAASVVSKKIASGADSIVLDVKYGSGAFLKTPKEAQELAQLMIKTGNLLNKKIDVVISSMEQPLGYNIGNSLEVIESIEFLKGNCAPDLYEITRELAAKTLINCYITTNKKMAFELVDEVIKNHSALEKFQEIIKAQGGNTNVIKDYSLFNIGKNKMEIKAFKTGFISKLKAIDIAHCAKLLGAGRDKKSDSIDYGAGIVLKKKVADFTKPNETIMELYYNDVEQSKLDEAVRIAQNSFILSDSKPDKLELIYKN